MFLWLYKVVPFFELDVLVEPWFWLSPRGFPFARLPVEFAIGLLLRFRVR
jgi:hypothetical protein